MPTLDKDNTIVLGDLRNELLECDKAMIALLSKRMHLSGQIGRLKSMHRIEVKQDDFWADSCAKRSSIAIENSVSPDMVAELFELIHQYSISIQEQYIVNQ